MILNEYGFVYFIISLNEHGFNSGLYMDGEVIFNVYDDNSSFIEFCLILLCIEIREI